MESKYYTPDISEFHVGFEYEFKSPYSIDDKWIKCTTLNFNETLPDCPFNYYKLEGFFRVKYLDKKDIESLGFEFQEEVVLPINKNTNFFLKDNWMLLLKDNNKINIAIKDPSKNDDFMYYNTNTCVYNLIIKNKSQLKKLLEQLGI